MSKKDYSLPYTKVGIGMPVYNGERYIEESIKSNLNQSFEDFTLIISDNASTDRTQEICLDYAAKDKRIHYIHNPVNLGAAKNYSRCFDPSNCEYFRWSNADDLIEPKQIELCVNILESQPDTVLTYGKTMIIDEHGKLTSHYDDNLHLQQDSPADRFIAGLSSIGLSNILYGLIRKEQLAHTALLGNYIASDINLIIELTLYGKFHEIPEYLFSRRMHPQASSWDRSDEETQKAFWDTSKKKLWFQQHRAVYEYFKAVHRAPIASAEKNRIYKYLLKFAYWRKNKLAKEVVDYTKFNTLKYFKS
jgi:glycosyltransferase involved in cell wall biosynthesis